MYEESESQKESLIAKLGILEEERKKLIDEVTTAEQKLKEASRVSCVCLDGMLCLVCVNYWWTIL